MKTYATLITSCLFLNVTAQQVVGNYTIFADPNNYGAQYELHDNRINLVFLAEGYTGTLTGNTYNDYPYFAAHKEAIVQRMFGYESPGNPFTSPFNRYRDYFNIYWVWVQSNESGAGCKGYPNCLASEHSDLGVTCFAPVNNHFKTKYDIDDTHRLLLPEATDRVSVVNEVQNVMFENTTAPLEILLLVNTNSTGNENDQLNESEWGGGGDWDVNGVGLLATARYSYSDNPTHSSLQLSADLCLHELAHMLGEVLDEYWYDMTLVGQTNEAANRTEDASDPSLTWGEWQDTQLPEPPDADIGVVDFTNAWAGNSSLTYVFRPTNNLTCKMEYTASQYCAVCKEAMVESIHDQVLPYDSDDISPTLGISHQAVAGQVFDPAVIDTDPSHMMVTWYVNGTQVDEISGNGAIGGATDFTWTFDCTDPNLIVGANTITAEVFDETGVHDDSAPFDDDTRLVREAGHSIDHKYEIAWTVQYNGEGADLLVSDFENVEVGGTFYDDVGEEPWSPFGWFFDESPDIKVTTTAQGSTPFNDIVHESPDISANPNYVYVQVHNRGCETSTANEDLAVYTSIAGSWDSWPDNWDGTDPDVGYQIGTGSIPAIEGGESATIEVEWTVQDLVNGQTNWESCLLARIEDVSYDPISTQANITDWIWHNNNIAMHNVTVIDLFSPVVVELNKKPYPGGWVYVGNTGDSTQDFDLHFDAEVGYKEKPLSQEAEIVVYFDEKGFDISGAIADSNLVGLERLDSTLFLVTSPNARIENITVPADTLIPAFVGYGFLTQQVTDTMRYTYRLGQFRSVAPDTLIAGQHFRIKRYSRTLFDANAGDDQVLLVGDSATLSAGSIGESALFFWYDDEDNLIDTTQSMKVSPSDNTTYTVEVIAEADGYKDYDDVTVTVTSGIITSVVPNPASTTTVVSYKTSGITNASLSVVEVNTSMEVDNFTVTPGTGTKTIDVSGYNTGAHIITLVGDSENLDNETLMVQ